MLNDPFIGHHFGNYRIERMLGRGGMARVYLGWDEQLARPVAIKVLDDPFREQPSYAERFLREARAMAAWMHPNIVKVHSAGVAEGVTYYVMEYIHGHDLAEVMRQYASEGLLLPYSEVIRIGKAVSSALDYAHQQGIIHRDVKPSNVLIAEDGRVVLTDFGLAMNVAQGTLGEVFGSPQYIAPEQARSSAYAVAQSDLYSLGVMLYEMLVGQLPFNDPLPATLALQHINEPVPDPIRLNPALPGPVGRILDRALSKNPAERFSSGSDLMAELEAALQADEEITPATMPLPRTPGITEPARAAVTRAAQTRAQPPGPPAPPASRAGRRLPVPGCALLLVLLLAFGAIAAIVIANGGLPLAPAATATEEAGATIPAALPEETNTAPSPSETLAPTGTQTSTTTATPTDIPPTHTPTPTHTAAPTSTPEPEFYEIDFVLRSGNFFVINRGELPFPLEELVFHVEEDDLPGSVWDLELLQRDECVAMWDSEPQREAPPNLKCELSGKRVMMNVPRGFWDRPLEMSFRDEPLETCRFRGNNVCEYAIPSDWGQEPAYP